MDQARRRGGRNAHAHDEVRLDLPDVHLDTAEAAGRLLDETISQLRRGEISESRAKAISYLVTVRRAERDACGLEKKVEQIEDALRIEQDAEDQGGER